MRIVDRKTFLSLSPNTLFSKYEPFVFGPLEIKMDTLDSNDFIVQEVHDSVDCESMEDRDEKLTNAERIGDAFCMDFDCCGRDGCFDENQLFAVWDDHDVKLLIGRLKHCIGVNG